MVVILLCQKIKFIFYKEIKIYTTSCNFFLKINGAKIIKITRGILPEWYQLNESGKIDKTDDIHPSKYLWIKTKFDYQIENNSTINDLENCIDLIMK